MRQTVLRFALFVVLPTLVVAQQSPQATTSASQSSANPASQEKPRVFVAGRGSENLTNTGSEGGGHHWAAWGSRSTVDAHDESMEVTKDLQQNCSGIILTLNQSVADYTVMLNRESKQNRGLLRTNSQIQVANRLGDILGTNAKRTVGNAAKDACALILTDWGTHGRLNAPAGASAPESAAAPGLQAASQAQIPQAVTVPTQSANAAPQAACSLVVSSTPSGADIEIDGSFVGNTPSTVSIAPGNHLVAVRKKGFSDWSRTLNVTGGNVNLNATLDPVAN